MLEKLSETESSGGGVQTVTFPGLGGREPSNVSETYLKTAWAYQKRRTRLDELGARSLS